MFSFVLVRSHRGGLQGLLLTCNNSRGQGIPFLPNQTPGPSHGNGRTWRQNTPNGRSNLLFHEAFGWLLGDMEMSVRGGIERKFHRAGFDKSTRFVVTLCSLLNFSLLLIYNAESAHQIYIISFLFFVSEIGER